MGLAISMPQMSIPFFPHQRPGEPPSPRPERINPERSTNLARLVSQFSPEVLHSFELQGHRWGLTSVLHPYTRASHVMLAELTGKRYLPGPESIPPGEGDQVFRVAALALQFLCRGGQLDRCCVGYNWSPRSWGVGLEEHGGYQSVPTLFHLMLWAWEPLPEPGKLHVFNNTRVEWVEAESLDRRLFRLLVENDYGEIFGRVIAAEIEKAFAQRNLPAGPLGALLDFRKWTFDARGVSVPFGASVCGLIAEPGVFSRLIRPIGVAMNNLMIRLTEALTTMDCRAIDRVLRKVETGPLSSADLEFLRATPAVRPEHQIRARFQREGWPLDLMAVLLPPVRARCAAAADTDPADMWRKGFGYSLVLGSPPWGGPGEMRILPGVYLGPGGVVEAQRVILKRLPVDAPEAELRRRSRFLQELGRWLASEFG
ncbi:MAG TPA: hypothetical protein VFA33_28890 [Bryobacteraceae bacterium]|nr:hypothetical protein [Bryobacteraceae bacterium]